MSVKRHKCYICGKKRYRSRMEKLPVLNISFFHMAWTNTYICKEAYGAKSYKKIGERHYELVSICHEKHIENVNTIIDQFTWMIISPDHKLSGGKDNPPADKLSTPVGQKRYQRNEAQINVKFKT